MEKPLGVSAADARGIAERAAAEGGFVAVPLGQRYHPFAQRAHQLVLEARSARSRTSTSGCTAPATRGTRAGALRGCSIPRSPAAAACATSARTALDLFLHLTGEDARVTAAQVSRAALGLRVEDSATALLRTASGVIGTVEIGNTMPLDGTDADWKLAWRDGYLRFDGSALALTTADGEDRLPRRGATSPSPARPEKTRSTTGAAASRRRSAPQTARGRPPSSTRPTPSPATPDPLPGPV